MPRRTGDGSLQRMIRLARRAALTGPLLLFTGWAALAPSPAAAAPTVTKVMSGGVVRYAGSIQGTYAVTEPKSSLSSQVGYSWDTTYPIVSAYDDFILAPTADTRPLQYADGDVGSAKSTNSMVYRDSSGKEQTRQWTCSGPMKTDRTNPPVKAAPPEDLGAQGLRYRLIGSGVVADAATCSDPQKSGVVFPQHELTEAIIKPYTLPATPRLGQPAPVDVSMSGALKGSATASGSFTGGGKITMDCLLCVTAVRLEQAEVPSSNRVQVPDSGTTDGNVVYVRATIRNTSNRDFASHVAVRDASTGKRVYATDYRHQELVDFPAGQSVTLEWPVDTDGMAWKNGQPNPDHRLEILTGLGGGSFPLRVLPKPMILVHGWNSDASTWNQIKTQIPGVMHVGYLDRMFAVGDGQVPGTMNTDPFDGHPLSRNAAIESQYIEAVRDRLDAQHVDLVAHSMGGLISRYYVQHVMPEPLPIEAPPYARSPVAAHLVMLGTPNRGSACAYIVGTVATGIPTLQLTPKFWEGMNKVLTDRRGVKMSVMAGDFGERTCTDPEHGDGVVAKSSAWHDFTDVGVTFANHFDEPKDAKVFGGWIKARLAKPATAPLAASVQSTTPTATAADTPTTPEPVVIGAGTVDVGARATVEVPLGDLDGGAGMSVTLLASSAVGSALVGPDGAIVDATAAGSADAAAPMRLHRVEAPAGGRWTLRLTGGPAAAAARYAIGLDASPLRLDATATRAPSGRVAVTAALTDGGNGVRGASVRATLRSDDGRTLELTLGDDGRSDDGEAGDGIYGASTAEQPTGAWTATVTATHDGRTRLASTFAAETAGEPTGQPGDRVPDTRGDTPHADTDVTAGHGAPTDVAAGTPQAAAGPGPSATAPGATLRATVAKPRDRTAPYAWKVSGTLDGGACKGAKVSVTLRAGKKTVGTATARVNASCRWSATVKAKRTARGKLTLTASSAGAAAATLAVRAG